MYCLIEIIREARINGPNLAELLKTPLNQLEDDCLNNALLAAVESGSPINPMKLILRGATNVDEALAKSRNFKKHAVTAALLIIKAAVVNDRVLVMKLYGGNVRGPETKIPLTREDNLAELQAAVWSNGIKTVIPIEISRRNNASAVREELLLRTGVDKNNGTILWFGLRLIELEMSWLRKIFWVKTLKLARNEFTFLPPEMGNYLKQCIKLDLQWNKLREIPPNLLELPSLNELNLSHNNLVNIPDVPEWSASLVVLDLSYNRLSSLSNSAVAPTLKNLNISNNRFRSVPHCVCSFISLTTLNIANNSEIVALPSELGRLKDLHNLNLEGLNDLNDPPKIVRATTKDCIQYLSSRLRSARGHYHMKMMLVGKQAMGKTTPVARLHNNNKEIGNKSTVGVDVSEWKCTPAYNRKTFYFSIWDFAGQEEYYATHQCFLSKHSLYLLVWNVTEGDAGIVDLKLWLNNISARAPNSHIIIVGTFLDKVSEEDRRSGKLDDLLQKVAELAEQYHRLVVFKVIAVGLKDHMENVNKLKDNIYNAAAEYKVNNRCIMGQQIPSSYHTLENKLSTIHRLVKEGKHEPIMHTAEFKKMVEDLHLVDIQDNDELHTVTCFLHDIGALLHYDDRKHNLDDLYFVDPCWLCDLMSTVVTIEEQNPFVKRGILRSKNIPLLFKDKRFPYKYFKEYLTLLNRFEIALPLDEDYKRVLIPSMLPKKCPEFVAKQQPDYKSCFKRFILFHEGKMLRCPTPPGLWSRLLSRIMNTVKEVKNILSEQIPVEVEEDDMIISTNIHRLQNDNSATSVLNIVPENLPDQNAGNSIASETMSIYSTNIEGPLESTMNVASESSSTTNGPQQRLGNSIASETMSIYSTNIEGPLESTMSVASESSSTTNGPQQRSGNSIASETMSIYSTNIEGPLESTMNVASESSSTTNGPQQRSGNSIASETMSIYSTNIEGPLESTMSVASESSSTTNGPQQRSGGGSIEEFSVEGGGSLVYWSTGLVYNVNELTFSIESLAENPKYHDKDGILILASQGAKGRKILGHLIDIVEKLMSEWYPGLSDELKHTVPCPECLKSCDTTPCEFKVDQLLPLIADHKLTHMCGANHEVQLIEIVPDLLLADLDSTFLLDFKELYFTKKKSRAYWEWDHLEWFIVVSIKIGQLL